MKKYPGLLRLLVLVIVIQLVIGGLIYWGFSDWSIRGTFGDMFGAVNTLFSGLAFAGVIYAIILQSQELEFQRKELEMTRAELSKSAAAQNEQVNIMNHSARLNAISAKLNTYTDVMVNGRRLQFTGRTPHDLVMETLQELERIANERV